MRQRRGLSLELCSALALAVVLAPACGREDLGDASGPNAEALGARPTGGASATERAPTELSGAALAEQVGATEVAEPVLAPGDVEASRVERLAAPAEAVAPAEPRLADASTPVVEPAPSPSTAPVLEPAPGHVAEPDPGATPATEPDPGATPAEPGAPPADDLEAHAERPPTVALQHIDVRGEIVGDVAEIEVEQLFANTFGERLEAVYVFPLPENAAVRDMVMVVGERRIRADLMQRAAAVETYEAARDQGHTASLLEQERPNIFTMSVANIEPGVPIRVLVRYVEQLRYADGHYHFAFPTVVAPRFIPGEPTGRSGEGALPDTERVPDASHITPAVLPEGEPTPYTINFAVDLFAGMPIEELTSASVDFDAAWATEHAVRVALPPEGRQPNRDLAFSYALAGEAPATGMLSHYEPERGGFFSLMVEPPSTLGEGDVRPKEIVFVIDMSGSMRGQPLDAAKDVIRHALSHLNPDDTFQILRFSETASGFAPTAVPNTPENVAAGLAFVESLRGGGGTQMLEGVRAALGPAPDPDRMRVVLFLTDGFIGNDSEILAEVERLVGGARLFALGVGSSVNRFLLDKMAEVGRGTVHYVDFGEDPTEAVEAFYRRVRNPVLTDLEIDWGGLEVTELTPDPLPDVFEGTPLVVSGRYATPGDGTITVRGLFGRDPVELVLDVSLADTAEHGALPYLWARRQIDGLERQVSWAPSEEVQNQIVDLSLAYRVLTQYTAYVAVDERVSADVSDPLRTVGTPVALPEGMSGAAIGPQMIDWAAGENSEGETAGAPQRRRRVRTASGRGGGSSGPSLQVYGSLSAQSQGFGAGGSGNLGTGPVQSPQASSPSAPRMGRAHAAMRDEESAIDSDATVSYVDPARVVANEQRRLEACVAPVERDGELVLVLRIQVDPDGTVADVTFRGADGFEEGVVDCLRELVGGLRFTPFEGRRTRFEYTLRLPAP